MTCNSMVLACLNAVGVVLALPVLAFACTCGEVEPLEAFTQADAAFMGIASGTRAAAPVRELGPGPGSLTETSGSWSTLFLVKESFLGIDGTEVLLHATGTTCDFGFTDGESYLVYAYRASDGRLFTDICSRTAGIADAKKDISFLRRMKRLSEPGIVTGRVIRGKYDSRRHDIESVPLRNVTVFFESQGQRFSARTDRRGRFMIRGLTKGRYRIWTEPRTNKSNLGEWDEYGVTEWQEDLKGHGKVNLWFGIAPSAKVSGRVVDSAGLGVSRVEVEIAPVDQLDVRVKAQSKWTDDDGRFTFEGLWPGAYHLGLNIYSDPSFNDPSPRHFFPGVSEPDRATPITVAEGAAVDGFELLLPPRLREVAVTGTSVLPDGRIAGGLRVRLRHPRTGFLEGNYVITDSAGRFTIMGLEGIPYLLSALVSIEGSLVDSVPIVVTPGVTSNPVRLVVQLPKR